MQTWRLANTGQVAEEEQKEEEENEEEEEDLAESSMPPGLTGPTLLPQDPLPNFPPPMR